MRGFKLLAIRPLEGCSSKYRKNLKEGVIYKFYDDYKFYDSDKKEILRYNNNLEKDVINIKYPSDSFDLYSQDNSINISAIVGKNGSGKSTVLELFFLAVYLCDYKNILAYKKIKDDNYIVFEPSFSFNQVFSENEEYLKKQATAREKSFFDGLHEFEKDRVFLEIYYQNGNKINKLIVDTNLKDDPEWFKIEKLINEEFLPESEDTNLSFYSIALNYSIHSLNSVDMGTWIESIFHKNDGYQTPLVINPKREEGSIDIENEKVLQKSRMLVNTMDIISSEHDNKDLLLNSKSIKKIVFKYYNNYHTAIKGAEFLNLDFKLLNARYDNLNKQSQYQIESIEKIFEVKNYKDCSWVERDAYGYIIYKVNRIIKNYNKIFNDIDYENNLKKISNYDSHITFKLKQAINFINFDNHIKSKCELFKPDIIPNVYGEKLDGYAFKEDPNIQIEILNEGSRIVDEIYSNRTTNILDQINFLPPPFFDYDIHFSEEPNDTFEKLSSGEKQQIYSIHTIIYHLRNISSVKVSDGIKKYSNVNILLDEIELYFHPEMQRQFIKNLISSFGHLKKYMTNNIKSINIVLATHSPFILSDIPASNILRLNDGFPEPNDQNSFGANVHDLLANDFFLKKGFMGAFANSKINSLIDFLLSKRKQTKEWDIQKSEVFIEIIGEPFLKRDLSELLRSKKEKYLSKKEEIDIEIKRLKELKQKIR
jgi:hypothetical protein